MCPAKKNFKSITADHDCSYRRDVLDYFSSEEMGLIVQLKRFFEWLEGDPDFRDSVESGNLSVEYRDRLKRIGVTFDPNEVAMLWQSPDTINQLSRKIFDYRHDSEFRSELHEELIEICGHYHLLILWFRFYFLRTKIHYELHSREPHIPKNPKFNAWRLRRISAVKSELGFYGYYLGHPILAFELGDGCSIGCWFCAFAARKLKENFDYLRNREFSRKIIQTCVDLFGREGAMMALPYYGTEPHDNPYYLDFIKDYEEITGYRLCTSTAVPTDAKWLGDLISFYRRGPEPVPWPRLSVLSKSMLLKIHDLYSPEDLRDVSLLMQMRNHSRQKVTGGRILEEQSGLRNREAGQYLDDIIPQGSIACVSGFLINMVNQTIQLCSPCYTSKKWPYGYRVFDESNFDDAEDFRSVILEMIERNMPMAAFSNMPMRFRDDLFYRQTNGGFDLISPNQAHHFKGEIYANIGSLIAGGELTYNEMFDLVSDTRLVNPMFVVSAVQKLFEAGFLDEVYQAGLR